MSEALQHLKLFRILKFANATDIASSRQNNLTKSASALTGIVRLTIVIGLMLHVIACYFYQVCLSNKDKVVLGHELNESQQWYPPTYFINFPDSPIFTDQMTTSEKYLFMLYTATMFLGANEMGPVNPDEIFACVGILILCAFFNALIFSDLVILVVMLFEQESADERVVEAMNDLMNYIEMPRPLVQRIENFIRTN